MQHYASYSLFQATYWVERTQLCAILLKSLKSLISAWSSSLWNGDFKCDVIFMIAWNSVKKCFFFLLKTTYKVCNIWCEHTKILTKNVFLTPLTFYSVLTSVVMAAYCWLDIHSPWITFSLTFQATNIPNVFCTSWLTIFHYSCY